MIYGKWYGVCDFVVLSVVEVCADYGRVNVFHVCLNFGVDYGVGVCFLRLGVVLLLFAKTRSVVKSVKVSVVEIAKRTN